MNADQCERLKAVESLRGGVPNRAVVRFIPPTQPVIERAFDGLLSSIASELVEDAGNRRQPLLLQGGFGSGKSHWIESLLLNALDRGFVCSWIPLNKEVPLYDLEKMYRAAILNSTCHGRVACAIREIISDYNADNAPGHRDFFVWAADAQSKGIIDPRLGASLELFSNTNDEDDRGLILNEWMGFPLKVTDFQWLLEKAGQPIPRPCPRVVKDNYYQRFEFLGRLVQAAGHAGWVIFLDEVEMISKYSLRQRARSYANLARLMGTSPNERPAGLGVVAAITPDYSSAVLRDVRKNDLESIPAKLPGTRDEGNLAQAMLGMRMIDTQGLMIEKPTPDSVRRVYSHVEDLYRNAYDGWDTPDVFESIEYSSTTSMRKYIRIWINVWDMHRVYGYHASPEITEVEQNYEEESEYQRQSADGDEPETIL
jgi:hypothetical protein